MAAFKAGKKDVLIATDVAARGIDVDDVTHVINYTIPEDDKAYLHRVGRTGRAGRTGIAVTFVDWDDMHKWALIGRALDLPLEPAETYSSSPHLYTDLDIPEGTKGRLKATSVPRVEKTTSRPPRQGGNAGGTSNSTMSDKPAGAPRQRDRRRTSS
jgi:superfamily II DNA/RNA helicase